MYNRNIFQNSTGLNVISSKLADPLFTIKKLSRTNFIIYQKTNFELLKRYMDFAFPSTAI
jgi:hypothetical protein